MSIIQVKGESFLTNMLKNPFLTPELPERYGKRFKYKWIQDFRSCLNGRS